MRGVFSPGRTQWTKHIGADRSRSELSSPRFGAEVVRLDARDHHPHRLLRLHRHRRLRARSDRDQDRRQHHHRHRSRAHPDPRVDPADRHLRRARQQPLRRPDHGDRQRRHAASGGSDEADSSHRRARRRPDARRRIRPSPPARSKARSNNPGDQLDRHHHLRRLRPRDARHHLLGGAATRTTTKDFYAAGGGITRLPERSRHRRRLHVGGLVPRHCRARLRQRLLRPDLLDRLPRRLAVHHVPDGRAAAQSRPLHLRRRRLLPPAGDADPRLRGDRHAGDGVVLPDRADGRRGPAHRAAVRPALSLGGRRGRRADDHLRHLRRHDRDDLGADHQGGPAARRLDPDGDPRAVAVRLRLQRPHRQGDRGPSEARRRSCCPARRSPIRSTRSRSASR